MEVPGRNATSNKCFFRADQIMDKQTYHVLVSPGRDDFDEFYAAARLTPVVEPTDRLTVKILQVQKAASKIRPDLLITGSRDKDRLVDMTTIDATAACSLQAPVFG